MFFSKSFPAILALCASGALATPVTRSAEAQQTTLTLQQQLELAGTAVDRLKLLPNASDFEFDFSTSTAGITEGIGIVPQNPIRDLRN
jgi:hypothetical protein